MSESKHTPGPWQYQRYRNQEYAYGIWSPENARLARVDYRPQSCQHQALANARLIAVVPELLEACEDMLCELESLIVAIAEVHGKAGAEMILTRQQVDKHGAAAKARAAVAKAKPDA